MAMAERKLLLELLASLDRAASTQSAVLQSFSFSVDTSGVDVGEEGNCPLEVRLEARGEGCTFSPHLSDTKERECSLE